MNSQDWDYAQRLRSYDTERLLVPFEDEDMETFLRELEALERWLRD